MKRLLALALISIGLMVLGGCAVNPATGTPDLVFMSETKEIELGKELHKKIIESTPIYQDEKLQAYVNEVGQKVAKNSHRPDLEYTFTIIDSPDINAFALPGGFIYINRGLLGYLQSEAQMAAVLAHEVGHVTGRHSVRQDAARKGSSVVTVLSVLTTGSTVIGDVTDLWGTAAVMGYGREMELEADGFGAEYLYNSGYNPKAMIEVIGVLKDQERFSRRLARESGKKTATYHGVFSTHPRNDQRLQEVVGKAVKLSEQQAGTDNKDTYRKHIEGMLYGINYQPKTAKTADRNTYAHSKLGFAVDFPEGWEVENQRNRIVAMAPDKHAEMTIEVDLLRQPVAPDDYIRDKLKIPMLRQSEAFKQFGLVGHKGLIPTIEGEEYPTRLAVLYQNRRIYVLKGKIHGPATEPTEAEKEAKEAEKASEQAKPPEEAKAEVKTDDELFVDTIHTFRPQRTIRRKATKSKSIHFVKANDRTSFAALAKHVQLGKYTEEQLRLLNGFYPRGEPEPGDWIKIVR